MDHNISDEDRRGQVGIGTLIVFIAMVLVAAIAAGVLINTAGFLQNQAEDTGTESTKQVADNLNVITEVGNVSANDKINELRVGVQPAAGANDINLAQLTIQYVNGGKFANVVVGNDSSGQAEGDSDPDSIGLAEDDTDVVQYVVDVVTAENEGDVVMTDNADRYELVIPLDDNLKNTEYPVYSSDGTEATDASIADQGDLGPLDEGQSVELTITTEVGSQTVAFLQVPDSLSGEDEGSAVGL